MECSSIKQTWIEYRLIHNANRLLFLTYSNIRYISFILKNACYAIYFKDLADSQLLNLPFFFKWPQTFWWTGTLKCFFVFVKQTTREMIIPWNLKYLTLSIFLYNNYIITKHVLGFFISFILSFLPNKTQDLLSLIDLKWTTKVLKYTLLKLLLSKFWYGSCIFLLFVRYLLKQKLIKGILMINQWISYPYIEKLKFKNKK